MSEFFLLRFQARQETEKRARRGGRTAAGELLRDPFRHTKNISSVLVVILHQGFLAKRAAFLFVAEPLRDRVLDAEVQGGGGAAGGVMQVRAQAEEKIVGRFDSALV